MPRHHDESCRNDTWLLILVDFTSSRTNIFCTREPMVHQLMENDQYQRHRCVLCQHPDEFSEPSLLEAVLIGSAGEGTATCGVCVIIVRGKWSFTPLSFSLENFVRY